MRNSIVTEDLKFMTDQPIAWERLKNKTVLVSGAAGFLPSYMVETLLYLNENKNFNIKIIGLVRTLNKAKTKFKHALKSPLLHLIEQDVCHPIYIEDKIDFIIHAASFATPKVFKENPIETILPNVIGTKNLLDLAHKNHVEGFLYFSTSGVYGFVNENDYPIKEDCFGSLDSMDISSCYLESKRMGEMLCSAWMYQKGVPIRVVRPAITYGPGLELEGGRSFEDFISCIVKKQDIILYSNGTAIRNFCYIADATLGFFTVMLNGKDGEAYNVATEHEISIKELAEYLTYTVFPERKLKVIMACDPSKEYLRMNFSRTTVDISKIKALGWKLTFPIAEGFKRVVESCECM
ncbi:MAG: NAD-dependent epimerase/dehydratase family protein [Methylocystaceae bacterium]|nr:NAD-dependent epimerase/dehydratase family protein [Methylocystaceae bacterium]